ncbi:MAG: arginase [Phycisphaerae bacterium]|nr:arginase [Phycisphaerae bacterium]
MRSETRRGSQPVVIVGAPSGLGGRCRGTGGGPTAIRAAGLERRLRSRGLFTNDYGDVFVRDVARQPGLDPGAALACAVSDFTRELRTIVRGTILEGSFPLVLGGEHSLAAGSQAGVGAAYRALGLDAPGLIWFDAHADCNDETSTPSGNLHGMPLGALLGLDVAAFRGCVGADGRRDPRRTVCVAQRDIDPGEREHLDRLGVRVFDGAEVRRRGIDAVMAEALVLAAGRDGRFSMSFDLDSLDPSVAPGVDCPVEHGLTLDDVRVALAMVADHGGLVQLDVVEVNPTKDPDGRTAALAVEAATTMLARLAESDEILPVRRHVAG